MNPFPLARRDLLRAAAALAFAPEAPAAASRLVQSGPDGRLVYAADSEGNRIPDFSACGYGGGGVALPEVPARITLRPPAASEDATAAIQEALDRAGRLPPDANGFRGAVLLARGRYRIGGVLTISRGGVVLRGEGSGEDGTVLIATGTKQRALIEIRGALPGRATGEAATVSADYVPVGATVVPVHSSGGFRPGDMAIVRRAGNAAWIHEIGMDRIRLRPDDPASTRQWTPFDLEFERRVLDVRRDGLLLDAPVTCAIERRWGGGAVQRFDESGRIARIGVESLRGVSEFDPSVKKTLRGEPYAADERHAWSFIRIENANDVWVRGVAALHFGFACVDVGRARHVTVTGCDIREMVSEIAGSRRYPYSLNGQLCLVERCSSDSARHDFAVGARVCGPNVFLECAAGTSYATSEPHHRWSVGGLYDNVRASIAIQDRQYYGTGHGWAGANYVVWNCEGPLVCQSPPTARNWAIGQVGPKRKGAFEPKPDGIWESPGTHVEPASLYRAQLRDRLSRL